MNIQPATFRKILFPFVIAAMLGGIAPSLAGTKNVLCIPIKNTVEMTSTELQTASVGSSGEVRSTLVHAGNWRSCAFN